jgi:hypothetical protein
MARPSPVPSLFPRLWAAGPRTNRSKMLARSFSATPGAGVVDLQETGADAYRDGATTVAVRVVDQIAERLLDASPIDRPALRSARNLLHQAGRQARARQTRQANSARFTGSRWTRTRTRVERRFRHHVVVSASRIREFRHRSRRTRDVITIDIDNFLLLDMPRPLG